MLLAQLREQVSNPQASASRPLPAVEREAKLRDLRMRLGGIVIEQQLEASHHLIDLFSQQWGAKQLEYISPELCTSREWEITRGKSNKQLSLDNEKLLIKEEKSVPDQPVTSSELLILESMRRRGVAIACMDIISWEVHERYLQELFSYLRLDPPENFMRVTIQQVMRADRDRSLCLWSNKMSAWDVCLTILFRWIQWSWKRCDHTRYLLTWCLFPRQERLWWKLSRMEVRGTLTRSIGRQLWCHTAKERAKERKEKERSRSMFFQKRCSLRTMWARMIMVADCASILTWASVIKLHMEHIARMDTIFAAARDVLPRNLFQNIKMVRRIDGWSASQSLLLMVRDYRTA